MTHSIEKWRKVWRQSISKRLGTRALLVLEAALKIDDPRLIQGAISSPAPLDSLRDCQVKGTCLIGFCGWQAEGRETVGEVESYFHAICDACEADSQEPAICRYFLNWFDDCPRDEMRREMLAEVRLALAAPEPIAA